MELMACSRVKNRNDHSDSARMAFASLPVGLGRHPFQRRRSCGKCNFTRFGPRHIMDPTSTQAVCIWTLAKTGSLCVFFNSCVASDIARALKSKDVYIGREGKTLITAPTV